MEASQTTSQSLSPKRDDVEIRPETVLQKTIKEAENAHKEQQGGMECVELWIRVGALARICFGDTRNYYYALSQMKVADYYLHTLGYHEQSLRHSTEALNVIDSLTSTEKNNPNVVHIHAYSLCLLADVQLHQGNLAEAEENLMESERLAGVFTELGNDPDFQLNAKIALNMGRLCYKQCKFKLASECIEKSLELFQGLKEDMRDASLELGVALELSDTYIEMSDSQAAISHLNEIDKFSSDRFGPSSVERAEIFLKMASVYVNMLKQDMKHIQETVSKAEDHLWDAYNIFTLAKGSTSPKALSTQDEIVKLFVLVEKYKEAINVLKDLIPNKCKQYGEGSLEVAGTRKVLGSLYLHSGEMKKAFQELQQVREVYLAVHGPNHRDCVEVSRTLETLTGSEDGTKTIQRRPFNLNT